MKFKFECTSDCTRPVTTSIEFDVEQIDEVRENFILFLRGVGFSPDTIENSIGELS